MSHVVYTVGTKVLKLVDVQIRNLLMVDIELRLTSRWWTVGQQGLL